MLSWTKKFFSMWKKRGGQFFFLCQNEEILYNFGDRERAWLGYPSFYGRLPCNLGTWCKMWGKVFFCRIIRPFFFCGKTRFVRKLSFCFFSFLIKKNSRWREFLIKLLENNFNFSLSRQQMSQRRVSFLAVTRTTEL